MQHNVHELTDKLLRALDTNYNVTDVQTVIDIICLLDKVAITKEVLEATRLGKHVNELRRNTSNEWLAKRAKELVKKWRNLVLPPSQPSSTQQQQQQQHDAINNGQVKQVVVAAAISAEKHAPGMGSGGSGSALEEGGGVNSKKRSAKEKLDANNTANVAAKRPRMNGGSELDLSDTSNSSFHDAVLARHEQRFTVKAAPASVAPASVAAAVIVVNSDSNSSIPDVKPLSQDGGKESTSTTRTNTPNPTPPPLPPSTTTSTTTSSSSPTTTTTTTVTLPPAAAAAVIERRRGRRKGSSAHRSLLDKADASFTSKMAAVASSRGGAGNARVKTTQELVASLQGRGGGGGAGGGGGGGVTAGKVTVGGVSKEDLVQKAAKLTERVLVIDQKLNTNANRYKNNGGSTTKQHHHHHHNRHNHNLVTSSSTSANNNNLLLLPQTSADDEDDVIVVDDEEVIQKHSGASGRHRKRRDSASNHHADDVDSDRNEERDGKEPISLPRSLDTTAALALLPPIDRTTLDRDLDATPPCTCHLLDNTAIVTATVKKRSDFSIGDEDDDEEEEQEGKEKEEVPPYEWREDGECPAKEELRRKYRLGENCDSMVHQLHNMYLPGVNCNIQRTPSSNTTTTTTTSVYHLNSTCDSKANVPAAPSDNKYSDSDSALSDNVVPNVYSDLAPKEAYKPYSISEKDRQCANSDILMAEKDILVAEHYVDDTLVSEQRDMLLSERNASSNISVSEHNACSDMLLADQRQSPACPDMFKSEQNACSDMSVLEHGVSATTGDKVTDRTSSVLFREYHDVLEAASYNGEMLRILPYVIID